MRRFIAHFLIILASWTLLIKFLLPVIWAVAEDQNLGTYIYWDFWWVAHIWLAYALLIQLRYLLALALVISVLEIVIITVKFALFLSEPIWTIWSMNWFVNKVFVLSCFILLLSQILLKREEYKKQVTPVKC